MRHLGHRALLAPGQAFQAGHNLVGGVEMGNRRFRDSLSVLIVGSVPHSDAHHPPLQRRNDCPVSILLILYGL